MHGPRLLTTVPQQRPNRLSPGEIIRRAARERRCPAPSVGDGREPGSGRRSPGGGRGTGEAGNLRGGGRYFARRATVKWSICSPVSAMPRTVSVAYRPRAAGWTSTRRKE